MKYMLLFAVLLPSVCFAQNWENNATTGFINGLNQGIYGQQQYNQNLQNRYLEQLIIQQHADRAAAARREVDRIMAPQPQGYIAPSKPAYAPIHRPRQNCVMIGNLLSCN